MISAAEKQARLELRNRWLSLPSCNKTDEFFIRLKKKFQSKGQQPTAAYLENIYDCVIGQKKLYDYETKIVIEIFEELEKVFA